MMVDDRTITNIVYFSVVKYLYRYNLIYIYIIASEPTLLGPGWFPSLKTGMDNFQNGALEDRFRIDANIIQVSGSSH